MKIKISNLGVVKEAEIDLKPLTVFIGENNTGKSWTAYALVSIFGAYGYRRYLEAYLAGKVQQKYPPLTKAIQELIEYGRTQINLERFIDECGEHYINDVAYMASSWMPDYMATDTVNFERLNLKIEVSTIKAILQEKIKRDFSVEGRAAFGSKSQEAFLNFIKEKGQESAYFYTSSQGNVIEMLPHRAIESFVTTFVFQIVHKSLYLETYPFPTERGAFVALPVSLMEIWERIAMPEREGIDRTNGNFPQNPVSHFMYFIKNTYLEDTTQRKEKVDNNPEIEKYLNLATFIENEILQGGLCFREKQARKILSYNISEDEAIEIHMASSSVKELTPLVLYLRYLAKPHDLIVIDEPEMNLHPAAQVEMAEFLAMLVQADLNVLITTHSPYIVDHLANLMQAAKHEDKDSIKDKFYLERTDAFIPQEKVSVYLFEDGTAKNILNEDGRIDWGTFSNVSEDLLTIADMIS